MVKVENLLSHRDLRNLQESIRNLRFDNEIGLSVGQESLDLEAFSMKKS